MRILIFTILAVSTTLLNAQNRKYGKISKAELEMTQSSIDTEAAAEVLYETVIINIEYFPIQNGFRATKEIEGRIKVYDKDKLDDEFKNLSVELYTPGSDRDKLVTFKGNTVNLEGGKIVTHKVKSTDIFNEKAGKYLEIEKMAFPNIQNGSVLEYKYTIVTPLLRDMRRWFFQKSIPVKYSSYKFLRPEFIVYSQDERGGVKGKVISNRLQAPDLNYTNIITEHIYENVPALKDEPYVFNLDNMKSSIRFEMMSFEYPGIITENYATSWEQIGKDFMQNSKFGSALSGNGFLDDTVNSLISNANTPLDKAKAIFDFVKNNYTWDRYNSFFVDKGIRQTFKDKTGNSADINLMLVSMLRKAELDASPVVLSTVGNMMINYSFPSVSSLNYVIAAVVINDKLYLMDGTEKLSDINMLPLRALNHRGFLVNEKGTREIQLTNYSLSTSKTSINAELFPDGSISGNFSEVRDMYFAMNDHSSRNKDPKAFEKKYLNKYNFDTDGFRIDENPDKGIIRYSFKFSDLQMGEVIGDKIIINPMLFAQLTKKSFVHADRNYPLEFGSLISDSQVIKIKIPEGYKLETIPENKQFVLQGDAAGYVYKVEEQNGYISAATLFQLGYSSLPPSYYEAMKDLENGQISAEAQQVVLVKK